MLYAVGNRVIGRKLRVERLQSILAKQVKRHIPVRVLTARSPTAEPGQIEVAGTYSPWHDRRGRPRYIEIIFAYNREQKFLKLSRHRWAKLCWIFADTVLHEIIHTYQHRRRSFKAIPGYESTAHLGRDRRSQNYYGDPDEIGAHAFNIACDLVDRFGRNFNAATRYLNSNRYRRHRFSTFFEYMKAFDHDHDHRIIRRVKKKTKFYLPLAYEQGRPFRAPTYLLQYRF